MFKVEILDYPNLFDRYKSVEDFFPLIGAVLLNQQNGNVYVDNPENPRQAYIEHAFGYAQIFGQSVDEFESDLENYLLVTRQFTAPKVRLYATYLPRFLDSAKYDAMRSYRQRFYIDSESKLQKKTQQNDFSNEFRTHNATNENIEEIERLFGVVLRFWRSFNEFLNKANAVVISVREEFAGICYAAAEADCRVEIDVLTLPRFRNLGVGKFAVSQFVKKCLAQSLLPMWDCYINNIGSMTLGKSSGFTLEGRIYPFFTIDGKTGYDSI